jgi:hypothetical protein
LHYADSVLPRALAIAALAFFSMAAIVVALPRAFLIAALAVFSITEIAVVSS